MEKKCTKTISARRVLFLLRGSNWIGKNCQCVKWRNCSGFVEVICEFDVERIISEKIWSLYDDSEKFEQLLEFLKTARNCSKILSDHFKAIFNQQYNIVQVNTL